MSSPDSFNLIDEPWIRALMQGGEVREFSLREVLSRAPEIRRLAGELPTQDLSILRVLEASILGASRPNVPRNPNETLDLWEAWWRHGAFPMDLLNHYLDLMHSRFDLLHETAPFYQVAKLTTSSGKHSGLTKLIADFPDGHPFFTTRGGFETSSLSLPEAARWLIHCQAFDPSGIKSGALGDPRVKGGKGYPFGYPAWAGNLGLVIAEGANLFETLMLNLPWLLSGPDDLPAWERPALGPGVEDPEHHPQGPADLFTWPSRRLRLFLDGDRVVDVQISNGDKLTPQDRFLHEPMSAWRHSKNQSKGSQKVYMPVTHQPSRRVWQGLDPLLSQATPEGATKPAFVVEWLASLRDNEILDDAFLVDLRIVGFEYGTQNSVIDGAVDDRLTAPVAALTSPILVQTAIDSARRAAQGVIALANLAGNLDRAAGGDGNAREAAFERGYSLLDAPFRSWVRSLLDEDQTANYETLWDKAAFHTLLRAGNNLLTDASRAAIIGRDVTQQNGETIWLDASRAQIWFRNGLNKALPYKDDEVQP
ncbi:type I-E CRISPR-associated protein Cse1/CasA [Tessaracoccus caeni]|uniref:type I-E CRISPR-associated protein Cse1/CasA n=1 Tax=Tessaracoccus caeni TaxID=3031239 RepID=UPI0023DC93C7|nr:type I-E CRISPR-associated protein Cse1/CasA [Tessaracoccus caeni]MDF1487394.1 type I-E CRISPR-associated protein Cse1/CasA [Tessaracoccus caeni]